MKTITKEFRELKRATLTEEYGAEYQFKLWEKGNHSRVYVNYRGKRSVGYIDLKTGIYTGDNNETYLAMVNEFMDKYMEEV